MVLQSECLRANKQISPLAPLKNRFLRLLLLENVYFRVLLLLKKPRALASVIAAFAFSKILDGIC